MTWFYENKPFQEPSDYTGFVYEIHDTINDRLYIGKKLFYTTKKLPPLKGKTNRRHRRVQSDWQEYYGSNTELQAQVALHGGENFRRTILVLCENRNTMSYWEAKIQFDRDVLLDNKYYNQFIGCRINRKGLKNV